MAPKARAPAKAAKATAVQAKPKGLQLSAAQWKAYDKAYGAALKSGAAALSAANTTSSTAQALAARRAALGAAAGVIARSRLSAAHSISKKAAAAHSVARTSAIARFAVQQSWRQATLAHQNKALVARVYADYQRHVKQAARLQYIYKGEKAYAHTAIMRTVTAAQAMAIAQAQFSKAATKSAGKALASVNNANPAAAAARKAASKAASARLIATARAAGLAAAEAVPPAPKRATVKKATASRTRSRAISVKKAKAPVKAAAKTARTARRSAALSLPGLPCGYGDPQGYDCVAAAIASHLTQAAGCLLSQGEYGALVRLLGPAPDLGEALTAVMRSPLPGLPALAAAVPRAAACPGDVIGFATAEGAHAAVYLGGNMIVSWGELLPLREVLLPGTAVEESWDLTWAV